MVPNLKGLKAQNYREKQIIKVETVPSENKTYDWIKYPKITSFKKQIK